MKVDGRRMCDRCGEEIERGEHWFLLKNNGAQVCAHCLTYIRMNNRLPAVYTILSFRDDEGGVSVFIEDSR